MNNNPVKPKKILNSFIVPKEINVLISSMGGVGTTFLIEYIKKYRSTNLSMGEDGFKHLLFPPLSKNHDIKYIYLFGNPIDSVISLFRRNFHYAHSIQLLSFNKYLKAINPATTLEQYTAEGEDRFLFSEQFNNWLTGPHFYPTLFLKYEKLWDNMDTLFDFLDIPRKEINSFPAKKQRSADFSSLNKDTQDSLKKIYGDFEKYINEFDDCLIVNDRKKRLVPGMFFTKTFYYSFRRNIAIKINDFSPTLSDYLENLYLSGRK